MQVTTEAAQDNIEELIDLSRAGEEIVIVEGKTPIAKIVPIPPQKKFTIGLLKRKVEGRGPDFF